MGARKKKFYAVRVGRVPGIYHTWEECQAMVHGAEGAEFKSFPTLEEAQAFLEAPSETPLFAGATEEQDLPLEIPEDTVIAFVDGSYDVNTKRYGYGCVLLTSSGEEICENGWGDHPEAVSARNVAGELQATLAAFRWAEKNGYEKIRICHDYTGIAAWFRGEWRANTFVSKEYIAASEAYRGVLEVTFEKIAAHTGVKYNEMADRLAKEALGIGE